MEPAYNMEEVNQLHFAITSIQSNLYIDSLKRDTQKNTLEKDLKIYKDQLKLSFVKEQRRLQTEIYSLKIENIKLKQHA